MSSLLLFILLISISNCLGSVPCSKRTFGSDNIVCVCNDNHCDTVEPVHKSAKGVVQVYTSTKSGKRLERTEKKFNDGSNPSGYPWNIKVDRTKKYQKILGFGTSFSDAAALDLGKMSQKLQRQILSDLFSDKGSEFSLARSTIAGSDFSNRAYSYDDHKDDYDLKQFKLVDEDTKYKIPQMKVANQVAKHKPLKFFGSPWSGPAWLKTNGKLNGDGTLKGGPGSKYWKTYANYLLKWLQSYRSNGVEFWGMTVQNEPGTGFQKNFPWNTMGYTAEMEKNFVKTDLGPTLQKAGWGPDKFAIMTLDHNVDMLPGWADTVLNDKEAAKYYKGVAIHWYARGSPNGQPDRLDQVHQRHPNHFILATEACEADWNSPGSHIALGNWHFAETYSHDIILDLTHWTVGWVDWNMALDMTGGPNWAGPSHTASAQIIVNPSAKEYYKNPMYYAMAHFSKFLPPGTLRIATFPEIVNNKKYNSDGGLQAAAFQRPDNGTVFIVINSWNDAQAFTLNDPEFGLFKIKIEPHSFNTWVYYH